MREVKKDILTIIKSRDYSLLENELSNLKTNQKFLNETLKWASYEGDAKSVEILIKFGADPNYSDEFGSTVLHFAVKSRKEEIVIELIKHGAYFNDWICEGIDLFHWCIRQGLVIVLNYLIKSHDVDPLTLDDMGRSPLHLACMFGQVKVVEYILDLDVISVDARDSHGWTPLHYACSEAGKRFKEVLQVLFSKNADPLLLTDNNKTSLDLAYESGRAQELINVLSIHKMVQLLISVDSVICKEGKSSYGAAGRQEEVGGESNIQQSTLKLQERHNACKLSVWRKILLNDDVNLLQEYRDSEIWYDPLNPMSFEESQAFSVETLCAIFKDSFENGVGIYSHFNHEFRSEIVSGKLLNVVAQTSGLDNIGALCADNYTLMGSLHESILFVAFISGRFKVVELLLQMRQFDIIPACLWICLLVQKLLERTEFPQQIVDNLGALRTKSEQIAVDALNRVYFIDNSSEKQVTLQFLNTPLSCYGTRSLVDLADAGGCSNFLALPCCQLILDRRWYGNLRPLRTPLKWVLRFIPISILFYNPYTTTAHPQKLADPSHKCNQYSDCPTILPSDSLNRFQVLYSVVHAPGTKFFYHSLAHMIFLTLMSYVLIFDFHKQILWFEIICYTFVLGYAVEEIVQCILITLQTSIYDYISDRWNLLDLTAIAATIVGCVLRLIPIDDDLYPSNYAQVMSPTLYAARCCLLFGLMCFYLRIMFISTISEQLGPKLRMIVDMMKKDFLPLLLLFGIFILAFGILFQGLLYPNNWYFINNITSSSVIPAPKKFLATNSETIRHLLMRAIYGIFEADFPMDETNCDNNQYCVHPIGKQMFKSFFLIIYIMIVYIMLMNLLIALFSNTVSRIDERSKEHWLAGRYKLVEEYKERSVFPPPFNVIERIYNVCLIIWHVITCYRCKKSFKFNYNVVHKPESEVTLIVKFIIIQSFALKTSRYNLGSNESKDVLSGTSGSIRADYEMKRLKDKVNKLEVKLDKILSILSPSQTNRVSKITSNLRRDFEDVIIPKFSHYKFQEPSSRTSSRFGRDVELGSMSPPLFESEEAGNPPNFRQ